MRQDIIHRTRPSAGPRTGPSPSPSPALCDGYSHLRDVNSNRPF